MPDLLPRSQTRKNRSRAPSGTCGSYIVDSTTIASMPMWSQRFARSRQSSGGRSDGLNGRCAAQRPRAARRSDVLDGHLGYFVCRSGFWAFHDFIRTSSASNRGCRSPTWRQRSALNGRGLRVHCIGWRRGTSFSAPNRPPTAAATRCNSCRPAARCSHALRRWRCVTSAI